MLCPKLELVLPLLGGLRLFIDSFLSDSFSKASNPLSLGTFSFSMMASLKRYRCQESNLHSKNHVADFTFLVRRFNVNRHTPSAYVFLLWFHDYDHWFYVSGVFYLKNNCLARPRFELATARNTFQHKNTNPQPSVLGYSTSWKLKSQLPISTIFWIWSISKDVGSMFWLT
jgi:hypothetical protein